MTYAIRNSIIIFGLVIIVLLSNAFTKSRTEKKLALVDLLYQEKMSELNNLKRINPDLEKEKEIMAQHDEMQLKALNRTRFILKKDNPTLSYHYFTSLAERFSPGMQFDFRYEGSGSIMGTNFNNYLLSGKTNINNLYNFMLNLENQSPLVKLSSVKIEETEELVTKIGKKEPIKQRVLDFSLKVTTFFDANGKTYEEMAIQSIKGSPVRANPFQAKITQPEIDEVEMHYIDVEQAKIIGLSPETVTLQQDGKKIAILRIGDKVAHGYLYSINWEEEYAIFKTNSIGITMDAKLYLERE